jgi:hypothetical protein
MLEADGLFYGNAGHDEVIQLESGNSSAPQEYSGAVSDEVHQLESMQEGRSKGWDPLESISTMWENRRLFATGNGYMGLRPADTTPGDKVAILFGSKAPAVLRPQQDDKGGFFYFTGLGYLYGIMQVGVKASIILKHPLTSIAG